MLLRDKIVFISGIGPGMGSKLAIEAAREGAAGLVAIARTSAKLDAVEAALAALDLDTPMVKVPTDIRDRAQCDRAVKAGLARFGRIDGLVNSAFVHGPAENPSVASMDGLREAFETNTIGTMTMTQAVIPPMIAQGSGAIVMVSTTATRKVVGPTHMGYAMSKEPLESAVRHLAFELGPKGIRVNICFQGHMWGDTVAKFTERVAAATGRTAEAVKDEIASGSALKRIVTDNECARAVLFLISDYASAVTGAQLDINGGEWMP